MGQPLQLHHWQRLFRPTDVISNMIMLENYENMPIGDIDYANHSTLSGNSGYAAIQADGDNHVLRFFPSNNDVHRFFGVPAGQRIQPDQPFTLYFKFLINEVGSRVNTQLRVQATHFFRIKFDTNEADFPNPFMVWYDNPTHSGSPNGFPDQQVEENVWYEVWAHLKAEELSHEDTQTASRYEIYIRGGEFDKPTRITIDDDDPYKYLYDNDRTIDTIFLIGWTNSDHILHDNFYISFGDEVDLSTPDDRLWYDWNSGHQWDHESTVWKSVQKHIFEDGDPVGFIRGPVDVRQHVEPSSMVVGFDATFEGDRYSIRCPELHIKQGRGRFSGDVVATFDKIFVSSIGKLRVEEIYDFSADEIIVEAGGEVEMDESVSVKRLVYDGVEFDPDPQTDLKHAFTPAQMDDYFGNPGTFSGSGHFLIPMKDVFVNFADVTSDNINGQTTGFGPDAYFDGAEWDAPTNDFDARGFRGAPNSPLSFGDEISAVGGSLDCFRSSDFRSTSMVAFAILRAAYPRTNMLYPKTDSMYLTFLADFTGYTQREDDHAACGIAVVFRHGLGGSGNVGVRPLGLHIGGDDYSGGVLKVSIITVNNNDIKEGDFDLIDTGITIDPAQEEPHLFQLRIVNNGVLSLDTHYQVIVNPDSLEDLEGTPDFEHRESFGLANNNDTFGFHSIHVGQCFNDEQSVLVDQILLSEMPRKSVEPQAINLTYGSSTGIRSTRSPGHMSGSIPLRNDKWYTVRNQIYTNNHSFLFNGKPVRIGTARADGAGIGFDVIWHQTSNYGNREGEIGTGIFEYNILTREFQTYTRSDHEGRPVGTVIHGLPAGTYDIYYVVHSNNAVNVNTSPDTTLQNNRIVVGIGVTQDVVSGGDPVYTPDDVNLTWVDLATDNLNTAEWEEGNNYAKVQVTINDQDADWLYVVGHWGYPQSEENLLGQCMMQIVKLV